MNETLPTELHKNLRPLHEVLTYKANELRIFLLKIGPFVLKNNDYITDEVPESKGSRKINDLFPQEETNKISIEKPNTETLLSQLVTVDNITDVRSNESHVMIPKSIWDEMLSQIKKSILKLMKMLPKLTKILSQLLMSLKIYAIGLNINKNNIQMSFEKPKKIQNTA
ncbi:hypothetical protein PVAND_003478 [Polypedilum vanderplanki]|uniref:Uncharacterized protein n=1 Tax=Polypedilum vanderplanki TaxID=319348 RepID=A0A9J6BVY2_POLVA|nr:hypothetical protein PVAND_003478 [Polypedilum vanderplanki]